MTVKNIYTYTFVATCPANGEAIVYKMEIQSDQKILVEHIKTAAALIRHGYHEDIANTLFAQFGGIQTIEATHHGVDIKTVRS